MGNRKGKKRKSKRRSALCCVMPWCHRGSRVKDMFVDSNAGSYFTSDTDITCISPFNSEEFYLPFTVSPPAVEIPRIRSAPGLRTCHKDLICTVEAAGDTTSTSRPKSTLPNTRPRATMSHHI